VSLLGGNSKKKKIHLIHMTFLGSYSIKISTHSEPTLSASATKSAALFVKSVKSGPGDTGGG